jgi:hypothetical protein
MQNKNHTETSVALDQVIGQITAIQGISDNSSKPKQHMQDSIESILAQTIQEDGGTTSTQLRITMTMPLKACDWTCNCQCHVRTQSQTPQWLSAVVGTLFYSSTNTPSLEVRPCNAATCLRSQPSSSSRFTYYFPSWMMRKALAYSTWNKLEGKNASWAVKVPRDTTVSILLALYSGRQCRKDTGAPAVPRHVTL